MRRRAAFVVACLTVCCLVGVMTGYGAQDSTEKEADAIFSATGVTGGLIVHLGCADGRLTVALHANDGCVVHGLDVDPARIEATRQYIRSLGLYGPVSVECWDAPLLPYLENSVNLLVTEDLGKVSTDEVLRVLVPGGVAYVKHGNAWMKTVKPPRQGVDEWTHYLHDASGNPVAHDSVIGPPRHLQWTAGPPFSRSHEYTPSLDAVVSSAGRVFYIADEGPIATLRAPSEWKLVARDAYNGVLLWKRSIDEWFPRLYGWTQGPRQLQYKLVAVGDRVYVTLGLHAPLIALNAATGETITAYPDTEGTEQILCHNDVLLLVIRDVTQARREAYRHWEELASQAKSPMYLRDDRAPLATAFQKVEREAPTRLLAINAKTNKVIWKLEGKDASGLRALSVRACGHHVYCQKQGGVFCLDLGTGQTIWNQQSDTLKAVSKDAVVCVGKKSITLRSPTDGESRWTQPVTLAQIRDVLLIGDSVWLGGGKPYDTGNSRHTGPLWGPYFAVQHDLKTGKIVKEITAENPKHHHRCYDNKATDRYILGGRRGTEFLDLETGDYLWNSWARGTCRYGVMPCNGMIYVPPHACGCYITVKLKGFNALAPARPPAVAACEKESETAIARFEKGPAFAGGSGEESAFQPQASGLKFQISDLKFQISDLKSQNSDLKSQISDLKSQISDLKSQISNPAPQSPEWPTYRGDVQRSGRTREAVPTDLTLAWHTDLGGQATAPTVADGRVYVARPDQHQIVSLDGATGKTAWTFTAAGRVDSPPTLYNGHVLFGGRDGSLYCLRASDGVLAWRFRAARSPQRLVADGQLESVSPVHGSVLVKDGVVFLTAGRSSYLDGGIDLYRLNPATGEVLSKTTLYSPDPKTGRQPEQYGPNAMPGARSDILAADNEYLYLHDLTFTLAGKEVNDRKPHLFTLTDYLDDSWTHRSYWIFGVKPSIATGCSGRDKNLLYGRILNFDDTTVFGYGRENVHWSNEFEDGRYRLFARRRDADQPHWTQSVPVRVRSLVLAPDTLFAAGAGPVPGRPSLQKDISPTPLLLAYSTKDGTEVARYPIAAAPVLNGMAAAGGTLWLMLENGQLICMTKKGMK